MNREQSKQPVHIATDSLYRSGQPSNSIAGGAVMPGKENDKENVRQALHAINNSLHVLGLQTELARLLIDNGNLNAARAALDVALKERNNCGETTGLLQRLILSP